MIQRSRALVTYTSEETESESGHIYEQDCVYVECLSSGISVGPVWGHHDASVKRALATLSQKCTCGNRFHEGQDEEGNKVP